MKTILRFLNPISWPIWVKLGALVATVMVLVVLIGLLLLANLRTVDTANLQTFTIGESEDQRTELIDALNNAQVTLDSYVHDPVRVDVLVNILRDITVEPELRLEAAEGVNDLLDTSLMSTGLFSGIRLLTLDGYLVAGAGRSLPPSAIENRQNESDSEEFQAAENARLLGRSQDIVVSEQGTARIDIVQVVTDTQGIPAGYMIATVYTSQVIVPILRTNPDFVPLFSYVIRRNTADNIIFVPGDGRTRAEDSAATNAVQRARDGLRERGSIEEYTYQTEVVENYPDGSTVRVLREQRVLGYYVDVRVGNNSDLALIVEVPVDATFGNTLAGLILGNYVFVLAIAGPVLSALLVAIFAQFFASPLQNIRQALRAISKGSFDEPIAAAERGDEFGQVALSLIEMREQVKALIAGLEQRIAARSRDIQATQEISRFAATQRDIQTLMDRVVELIVQYFPNIYHAQIFLIDVDSKYAVLRASTGEPGAKLLERGHRLAVGSLSVIGRVTEQGDYVVARDTASSDVHRRNEFLPDTRSELAIPLRVGDKIIGALDVQSKKPDAFPIDEVGVLQTMADQIAVAIENAILYQESLRSLAEIDRSKRQQTLRDWEDYMQLERVREISSEYGTRTNIDTSDLRRAAIANNRTMIGKPTERGTIAIAVPLTLRGQVLGAAEWELPLQDFGEDKVLLAQELVNRLAINMENARLFQQSQVAAERERMVNTISAKLTSKQDINEILQTALREVGQALRAPEVSIRMQWAGGEQKAPDKSATNEKFIEIRTPTNKTNGTNGNVDHDGVE
ncbi:MAG: GAF domain-containing protein [Anaerolineae bacterium]